MKLKIAAGLLAGLSFASSSQAASVDYFLDQSNRLADGISYLQVTIDDEGAAGAVNFTVQALQPLLDWAGPNFGITKFGFNVVGGTATEADDVDGPSGWRARDGGRMDGFGLFDITLKGRGTNRQDPLTFSIDGVDLDTIQSYVNLSTGRSPQGFSLFSAQVKGFKFCETGISPLSSNGSNGDHGNGDPNCVGRVSHAYFGGDGTGTGPGPVVPAPAAIWLLGTAIAGLAVRRLRTGGKAIAA